MKNRIAALQQALRQEGLDAFLITSTVNQTYLTRFPFSDGMVLVLRDHAYLLTDSRYIEAARLKAKDCEVVLFSRLMDTFAELLRKHRVRTLVAEQSRITLAQWNAVKAVDSSVEWIDSPILDRKLTGLRTVKDADELAALREAQRITEGAFEDACRFLKPGMTEREAALNIEFNMKRNGAEALSFGLIVVTGAKTSMPHGVPGDEIIRKGDFVTMDTGAVYEGMHADMTRTVAIGAVSEEQRAVYDIVRKAQENAIAAVRAGVACKAVDEAARSVIRDAGYGDYFGHSTGHSVGMETHELPGFSPRSEDFAAENMVLTVEPGIYLPGKFGVRIEDMVRVTKNGCENLTKAEKSLIIL